MISLAPIHKKVRQTLVDREEAVSRRVSPDTHETISEKLAHKVIKSLWVKMYSAVEWKDIKGARIYGGEVFKNEGDGFPIPFGYTELYDTAHPLMPQSDRLKRPIAGIMDFNCNYKGALKAIREATINWVVQSLDDLERLIPFFASHGKGILLEWGYSSSSDQTVSLSNEADFVDGTAYSKINGVVLESGGTYDGMAGIISNYEWSLRDDGGFNVQTTIVSRGVNVLNKQLDQAEAPLVSESGAIEGVEIWPTLGEFMAGINETLITIAVGSTSWLGSDNNSKPLGNINDKNWEKGSKQPPGVFMTRSDGGWLGLEKNSGPFMTWGWMEDNILSKWVGKYDKQKNITNSFRSIEPKINHQTGYFIDEGGNETSDITQAEFSSVTIGNHPYLVTPHRDRWIIPGQFPYPKKDNEGILDKLKLHSAEFTSIIEGQVNNTKHFKRFAVDKGQFNNGGYLRNLLLSSELVLECFDEAKTLQQGLQKLFDEINSDVNGFWNFQVVNDPFLAGNIKVIDSKRTLKSPADFISEANSTDMSKVDKSMYVFESWGDASIIKTQTLSAKLPSSFAITAMYAGTSKKGTESTQGDSDGSVVGLMNKDGKDASQLDIVEPSKLSGKFGSVNPYLLEKAGDLQGKTTDRLFGADKGIEFDLIDWTELIKKYQKELEKRSKDEKDEKDKKTDKKKKASAKTDEPIKKFFAAFDSKELYDDEGNLKEEFSDDMLYKRVMCNAINGMISISDGAMKSLSKDKKEAMQKGQKSTDLYPIELELELDGIGGIYPGNIFHVSYLPNRFKNFSVFQIMSVDHTISSGIWSTKIVGQIRVASQAILKAAGFNPELLTTSSAETAEKVTEGESGGETDYGGAPSQAPSGYDADNDAGMGTGAP